MKLQRKNLLMLFVSVIVLCFSGNFVWAAPYVFSNTSGYCCVNGSLSQSTEKQCLKEKGHYFKTKALAEKECKPMQPKDVYCCIKGKIQKTSPGECSKNKGKAYRNISEAKRNCKPEDVYCCRDGKIKKTSPAQCKQYKGKSYKNSFEAKRNCKPKDVYCCLDGKIKKTSPAQCKQFKGKSYKNNSEAKRNCKPRDIYCCLDGKIKKTSPGQCKQYRGKAYKNSLEAKRKCKPKDVYCCLDGKVRKISPGQCRKERGNAYQNGALAKRNCKSEAVYCCLNGEILKVSPDKCRSKKGKVYKTRFLAQKSCRQKNSGLTRFKPSSLSPHKPGSVKLADLTITEVRWPDPAKISNGKNNTAIIRFTVKNIGSGIAPKNRVHLALNRKGAKQTPVESAAKNLLCPALKPGESIELSWPATFENDGLFAIHSLTIKVDANNIIREKNELNNRRLNRFQQSVAGVVDQGRGTSSTGIVERPGNIQRFTRPGTVPRMQNQGANIITMSGGTTAPGWTTVSGVISTEDQLTTFCNIQHISAQLLGPPSPIYDSRTIRSIVGGCTNQYSIDLPPSSVWLIQPVVADPLSFKAITPFAIATSAEGELITRDIVIEYNDTANEYYASSVSWCQFRGQVRVNGQWPQETLIMKLSSQNPDINSQNFPLGEDGFFSVNVPAGYTYILQPFSYAKTVYDNTIPAQEYVCLSNGSDFEHPEAVRANFDYSPPQLCTLSGRVTNNGVYDHRIKTLTLRTSNGSREPFIVSLSQSGDYQVEVLAGASYSIVPNVLENWEGPARRAFQLRATDTEKTVDFELFQPEFRLGDITEMKVHTVGRASPEINLQFETLAIGGDKEKYRKGVRITNSADSRLNKIVRCDFKPGGISEVDISLTYIDPQNDSLLFEIIDNPGPLKYAKIYPRPFKDITGDLSCEHGGALTIDQFSDRYGDHAVVHIGVKNDGPVPSAPCSMTLKVNNRQPSVQSIPSLSVGAMHQIDYNVNHDIEYGDEIVFQINNSCDTFTDNNRLSFIIENRDYVDDPDHEPVDDGHTETRMTGESTIWDFFGF